MFIIHSLLHSHIQFCSHLSLSFPILQVAGVKKAMNVFSKKKKEKEKDKKGKEEEEEEEGEKGGDSESRRKWLKVMMTNADGWRYALIHIHVVTCEYVLFSDPAGLKVRAVEGLHGIDYLAESSIGTLPLSLSRSLSISLLSSSLTPSHINIMVYF